MKFWNKYIILKLFFLISPFYSKAQHWCGLPEPTVKEKAELLKQFYSVNTHKNARKGNNYTIFLRPKIIHKTNSEIVFKTSQVIELLNEINRVFSEINIRFEIRENTIEQYFDDNFYDLNVKDEAELRKKYDKNDGINIYFVHSITLPDLKLLNGYTNLPNLSRSSNLILLSYLNNSFEDFKLLKDKIIVHELGHYFGLLHTYQDGNHPDVYRRELVTRGIGSNCSFTGDQLCDTEADPFERINSIAALPCNERIPNNIFDANGDLFHPPVDNYMSYHTKCGNHFTPMQYQKIEAGLNTRLSPNAEYRISSPEINQLFIKSVEKEKYCLGDTLSIDYEAFGDFQNSNSYSIELWNTNTNAISLIDNFTYIDKNRIKFVLNQNLIPSSNYRLILRSNAPYTESPISQHFEIKSKPTASIFSGTVNINQGEEVLLNIQLGGSGPWKFTDWNNVNYSNINFSNILFTVKPERSNFFTISNIENECGALAQNPGVFISVMEPNLQIVGNKNRYFCEGQIVSLLILGNIQNNTNNNYQIIIDDKQNKITFNPEFQGNNIKFSLPSGLSYNKNYELRLVGKQLGDFSSPIFFNLSNKPLQPKITSPQYLCYNSGNKELEADGQNLKWYFNENDLIFTDKIIVGSKQPGTYSYFVSQTDTNNCESLKSKIEVKVKEPLIGTISGSTNIPFGDSTTIKLEIQGDGPWQYEIENLGIFSGSTSDILIKVKPQQTTSYFLNSISNNCGSGKTQGEAVIKVGGPLSLVNEFENYPQNFKVYPNPSFDGKINIKPILEGQNIKKIIIYNYSGQKIKELNYNLIAEKNNITTDFSQSGTFLIKIITDSNSEVHKVVIK